MICDSNSCSCTPLEAINLRFSPLFQIVEVVAALISLWIIGVIANITTEQLFVQFSHEISVVKVLNLHGVDMGFTRLIVKARDAQASHIFAFSVQALHLVKNFIILDRL